MKHKVPTEEKIENSGVGQTLLHQSLMKHTVPKEEKIENSGGGLPHQSLLNYTVLEQHVPRKSSKCPHCNADFSTRTSMQRHVRTIHNDVKYPCSKCTYRASDLHILRRHVEAIHEYVKYPCDHCEYRASFKHHLKTHMKIHGYVKQPKTYKHKPQQAVIIESI